MFDITYVLCVFETQTKPSIAGRDIHVHVVLKYRHSLPIMLFAYSLPIVCYQTGN